MRKNQNQFICAVVCLFVLCLSSGGKAKAQAILAPVACQQFFSATGQPMSGGFLYTYLSGLLTPVPTYTDATGTIPNSNPIILNAGGYAVSSTGSCGIWLTLGVSYRFVLQNSSNVQQWAVDNIPDSGVFNLPNTWTSLQTFNAGIAVPGTSTMGTVNITGNLSVTGASNLNTINAISNPTSLAQDSTITLNYDNLFSYIQLTKNLTVVPNSIGFANITQMSGTPGVHGAYGFYNVADFTSLAGKLAVGADTDTYFKDVGVTNANVLPSQANSATTEGSANFTSPVTSFQGVVVHLGSGVLNAAVNFLAPNNSNLGMGLDSILPWFLWPRSIEYRDHAQCRIRCCSPNFLWWMLRLLFGLCEQRPDGESKRYYLALAYHNDQYANYPRRYERVFGSLRISYWRHTRYLWTCGYRRNPSSPVYHHESCAHIGHSSNHCFRFRLRRRCIE